MKVLELHRYFAETDGTFGALYDNEKVIAYTGERPWLNNQEDVSCIPEGGYLCERIKAANVNTASIGETFIVTDVPDRTGILFHVGNWPLHDSKGCILTGRWYGETKKGKMVVHSTEAFERFMEYMRRIDKFILIIKEV